jgi:hypothetical protein
MNFPSKILTAVAFAGSISSLTGSATAVPLAASLSLRNASTPMVQTVQWRRWGWRGGYGYGYLYYRYGYIYNYPSNASYTYYQPYYGYPRYYARWSYW